VVMPASEIRDGALDLAGAVEKPRLEDAPSNLGLIGRYLFDPDIFGILQSLEPGHGGEVQLTDAINELGRRGRLRGYIADADLLDIGNPAGLLNASIVLGLERFGDEFRTRASEVLGR
jgi:UTP--glucose-1-phosphate uridylyltransferase